MKTSTALLSLALLLPALSATAAQNDHDESLSSMHAEPLRISALDASTSSAPAITYADRDENTGTLYAESLRQKELTPVTRNVVSYTVIDHDEKVSTRYATQLRIDALNKKS
jgi:IS1 family transposase